MKPEIEVPHLELLQDLAEAFHPHPIYLVGGSVRDILLGHEPDDLDLCTPALPTESEGILRAWGERTWNIGASYGTVCAVKDGVRVEVTTFRKDTYDPDTRKPEVEFGTELADDLLRRDFKINAMAIRIEPFQSGSDIFTVTEALNDLADGVITTCDEPSRSFSDDPLRIIRAARFVAQLGFDVAFSTYNGMRQTKDQLSKVSVERIVAELDKLLVSPQARDGLLLLEDTGVAELVVPEGIAIDELDSLPIHPSEPQTTLDIRWAAWLLEATPEQAKARLRALKHNSHTINTVPRLIALANQFSARGDNWDEAQVRKFVWDAGELFVPAMVLISKTTDAGKFTKIFLTLEAAGDIATLAQPLTGADVMDWLVIPQGKLVGDALKFLQNRRLEEGPMTDHDAYHALSLWWQGKA